MLKRSITTLVIALCAAATAFIVGCGNTAQPAETSSDTGFSSVVDAPIADTSPQDTSAAPSAGPDTSDTSAAAQAPKPEQKPTVQPSDIGIVEDYRESLAHGDKGAEFQKYIVLHDTEGEGDPANTIDYWESSGRYVAAQFVVGKDGSIRQCVPIDQIAHHAGYGDAGHNDMYGITEDGRDDMRGATPIGDWAPDYGMNAWSIGIEMVHVGGSGDYPEEQLAALDKLIAYIDAYYGFESTIIDHKAWRSGNSDTSPEFAEYLANYQDHRTHN